MGLGARIRELRGKRSMTMEELGKKLGVTKTAIFNWENENRTPDKDSIIRISELFGVTTDYLLGVSDRKKIETPYYINEDTAELAQEIFENPELKILMSASRKLEKEDIEALVSIVQRMKPEEGE